MRPARHSWRRGLARLLLFGPPFALRGDVLFALTDEFEAGDRSLHDLLERDNRDTGDVPGFDDLADRQIELVGLIAATPARSLPGVVAKARCARLRPSERGFDAAQALALSASDDLLRLIGAPASLTFPPVPPADPSRATAAELPSKHQRTDMARRSDADLRSAILRRNSLWWQLCTMLFQIGVWSLCGAAVLSFSELSVPWFVIAALGLVAFGTISISFFVLRSSFFVLRFIDHSN